jgi:competence protein ComEC
MNRWITAGATGLITGIVAAMMHPFPPSAVSWLIISGLILTGGSLFLTSTRNAVRLFSFAGFAVLGLANTIRHQQTDTPGHLTEAVAFLSNDTNITLEGSVIQPPDIRENYSIIPLDVIRLQNADGIPVPVRKGNVYIRLYPSVGDIYHTIGYGDRLEFRAITLAEPEPAANPGAFDMKKFLNNQGFFATVNVRNADQITRMGSGTGNPFIRVAETVKNRLLIIIKKTLPYPESTFLGGVLLGLRSGLSTEVRDTFRAAGVSHVLAVSGLHVTIITLFFMGLFTLVKLPRTSSFLLIICALVLFTLITGARPSTVRAAIMNGVTLLFFYFRGLKLDRSFLLGISVAAIYILFRNPLLLTETAFLFSFSAVLSLALLTRPVYRFCMVYLRGFFRVFLLMELLFFTAAGLFGPADIFDSSVPLLAGIGILCLGAVADRFLPPFFEFRRLPAWFSTFFAAQIAIQLGMLPLTAFFFKKISVAAPMANFLAIPLIGVIVQLGLFAGILGSIPIVGIYPALCLNAANWLFIRLFLKSAFFFGTRFPFPDISPPRPVFLAVYYLALLLIVSQPYLRAHLAQQIRYIRKNWRSPSILARLIILLGLITILSGHCIQALQNRKSEMAVTLLDTSLFLMGGGNAVIIRSPGGHHFLVDAGPMYELRRNEPQVLDIGRRVVIPALLDRRARRLKGLILSGAEARNIGSAAAILENPRFQVETIYHALPVSFPVVDLKTDALLQNLNDPILLEGHARRRAELTAWALRDISAAADSRSIPYKSIAAGDIIYREQPDISRAADSRVFLISVLNPPANGYTGPYSTQSNSIMLFIQYGRTGIVLNSGAGRETQSAILESDLPPYQIVQLPSNGAEHAVNHEFVARAKTAIVSTLPSRWAQRDTAATREIIKNMGLIYLDATREGALTITSDGATIKIHSCRSDKTRTVSP